jgi:Flp pilus assembly pilin Flp
MIRSLHSNQQGAGAVEFALVAPVLISMVIGVTQLGMLFQANAGIQHAVEEAARVAAVYPTPSNVDTLVRNKLESSRFGMKGTLTPTVVEGKAADCMDVLDLNLSYAVPLDFIFFSTPAVTLTHSRRVFLQKATSSSSTCAATTGGTTTGGTTTGGTTTGGTTTGGTTTGGTTTGGTTTGGTTTGGTTTGGTTTPPADTGNNGNNGNGNGGDKNKDK